MNFLLIEALQRLDHYYGDSLTVEFPTGSGKRISLRNAAQLLSIRLGQIFLPDRQGTKAGEWRQQDAAGRSELQQLPAVL